MILQRLACAVAILFSIASAAETACRTSSSGGIRCKDGGGKEYEIEDPSRDRAAKLTGVIHEVSGPDGKISSTKRYKSGRLVELTTFYPDGRKASRAEYKDANAYEGVVEKWDKDGRLEERARYVDGAQVGPYERYEKGKLVEKGEYEAGAKEGLFVEAEGGVAKNVCYRKGNRKENSFCSAGFGEATRVETQNYPGGKLFKKVSYKGDKRDGAYEVYFPEGARGIQGEHRAGERSGTWRYWSKTGELQKTEVYAQGVRDWSRKTLFPGGAQKSERKWKAGLPVVSRDWYMNGQLQREEIFSEPGRKSHVKSYDQAGGLTEDADLKRRADAEISPLDPSSDDVDGNRWEYLMAYHGRAKLTEKDGETEDCAYVEGKRSGACRATNRAGALVAESEYKEGRLARQKTYADGKLVEDKDVFPDGSSKPHR